MEMREVIFIDFYCKGSDNGELTLEHFTEIVYRHRASLMEQGFLSGEIVISREETKHGENGVAVVGHRKETKEEAKKSQLDTLVAKVKMREDFINTNIRHRDMLLANIEAITRKGNTT